MLAEKYLYLIDTCASADQFNDFFDSELKRLVAIENSFTYFDYDDCMTFIRTQEKCIITYKYDADKLNTVVMSMGLSSFISFISYINDRMAAFFVHAYSQMESIDSSIKARDLFQKICLLPGELKSATLQIFGKDMQGGISGPVSDLSDESVTSFIGLLCMLVKGSGQLKVCMSNNGKDCNYIYITDELGEFDASSTTRTLATLNTLFPENDVCLYQSLVA